MNSIVLLGVLICFVSMGTAQEEMPEDCKKFFSDVKEQVKVMNGEGTLPECTSSDNMKAVIEEMLSDATPEEKAEMKKKFDEIPPEEKEQVKTCMAETMSEAQKSVDGPTADCKAWLLENQKPPKE